MACFLGLFGCTLIFWGIYTFRGFAGCRPKGTVGVLTHLKHLCQEERTPLLNVFRFEDLCIFLQTFSLCVLCFSQKDFSSWSVFSLQSRSLMELSLFRATKKTTTNKPPLHQKETPGKKKNKTKKKTEKQEKTKKQPRKNKKKTRKNLETTKKKQEKNKKTVSSSFAFWPSTGCSQISQPSHPSELSKHRCHVLAEDEARTPRGNHLSRKISSSFVSQRKVKSGFKVSKNGGFWCF